MDVLNNTKNELVNKGWIVCTRQGGRNIPSLYGLTWLPIDRCGGKLDVPHDTMPLHLWKPQNAHRRETRETRNVAPPGGAGCTAPRNNAAPPGGAGIAALHRRAEQCGAF